MKLSARSTLRVLCATTLFAGAWAGIAPASAHVHIDADNPVKGSTTVLDIRVPNESETGSPTTSLTIDLPGVASARTDVMAGWTSALQRDPASGAIESVTWTADPGSGIPADQFEIFQMQLKLPDSDTVSLPAVQTYADGTVVRWDQPTGPGGAEPEYPAPTLTLTAAEEQPPAESESVQPETSAQPPMGPDNIARGLAGGALLLAAIGVGIALVRRRA
ncbi:YcnI family protein [soil metagenome]